MGQRQCWSVLLVLLGTGSVFAQTLTKPTPSPPTQIAAPAQTSQPAATNSVPSSQPDSTVKNADGTYTVRTGTRLVVLDVVVTDRKGNIVNDLKREDFHVTEAGDPQTILNFEQAGSHTTSPALTINSTAELDRLAPRAPVNIILLDEFNTRFEDMAFARYSLKKYLQKQPDKLVMPTMLIAVSLEKFDVLRDYTQDKHSILDALDHHFAAYPWRVHQSAWLAERYSTAFLTLMRVAHASEGHIGHKNMIWLGRGFPSLNLANVALDQQDRIDSVVQDTVNLLRDARVTLYTIDPAGIQTDTMRYGVDAEFTDPFGGNYQFNKLAKATGGAALYGRNDVDTEINTSIRDGASFYTMTYRPGNTSLDPQKFRKIKVTLDRPGLSVTTREGYYLQRPADRFNPTSPSRRLALDLVSAEQSTMAYDGLVVSVRPKPNDAESYLVHVDAPGVAWYSATGTEPRQTEVILMVSTFDKKGKELKCDARNLKIAAPSTAPPTGRINVPLNVLYKFDRDGGKAVRARVVVRMAASGRIGTADVDLTAPALIAAPTPASATPAISTPPTN